MVCVCVCACSTWKTATGFRARFGHGVTLVWCSSHDADWMVLVIALSVLVAVAISFGKWKLLVR